MEVKLSTEESEVDLQNSSSHFQPVGLVSGTTYKATFRSQNKQEKSDPVYMLIEQLKNKVKVEDSDVNQILPINIGAFVTVTVCLLLRH